MNLSPSASASSIPHVLRELAFYYPSLATASHLTGICAHKCLTTVYAEASGSGSWQLHLSVARACRCLFFLHPVLCFHFILWCGLWGSLLITSCPAVSLWRWVPPVYLSQLPGTPEGGELEGGWVEGYLRSLLKSLPIVRMVTKALFVDSCFLDTWNIWLLWYPGIPFSLGAWYIYVALGGNGREIQGFWQVP